MSPLLPIELSRLTFFRALEPSPSCVLDSLLFPSLPLLSPTIPKKRKRTLMNVLKETTTSTYLPRSSQGNPEVRKSKRTVPQKKEKRTLITFSEKKATHPARNSPFKIVS